VVIDKGRVFATADDVASFFAQLYSRIAAEIICSTAAQCHGATQTKAKKACRHRAQTGVQPILEVKIHGRKQTRELLGNADIALDAQTTSGQTFFPASKKDARKRTAASFQAHIRSRLGGRHNLKAVRRDDEYQRQVQVTKINLQRFAGQR